MHACLLSFSQHTYTDINRFITTTRILWQSFVTLAMKMSLNIMNEIDILKRRRNVLYRVHWRNDELDSQRETSCGYRPQDIHSPTMEPTATAHHAFRSRRLSPRSRGSSSRELSKGLPLGGPTPNPAALSSLHWIKGPPSIMRRVVEYLRDGWIMIKMKANRRHRTSRGTTLRLERASFIEKAENPSMKRRMHDTFST